MSVTSATIELLDVVAIIHRCAALQWRQSGWLAEFRSWLPVLVVAKWLGGGVWNRSSLQLRCR